MPLSTQLLNEHQAEVALLDQKRYNSWRQRRKRHHQEKVENKRNEVMQLYRDILPSTLAHAFGLDIAQIIEMRTGNWRLGNKYDLIYLVDDIVVGISFRSQKKWQIEHFTSATVSGSVIFYEAASNAGIKSSRIPSYDKAGLKIALTGIENSELSHKYFQDSPQMREMLGLTVRE